MKASTKEFEVKVVFVLGIQGRTMSGIIGIYDTEKNAERARKEYRKQLTGALRDESYVVQTFYFTEKTD